jgi:hypothetical protein
MDGRGLGRAVRRSFGGCVDTLVAPGWGSVAAS